MYNQAVSGRTAEPATRRLQSRVSTFPDQHEWLSNITELINAQKHKR